jgi:tetratricopeptide (TPR) repeat protein
LEGKALGNPGDAYLYMGQADKAIEFYEQPLSITRNLHDQRGEGNALELFDMIPLKR